MAPVYYPRLIRRLQASWADGIVMLVCALTCLVIGEKLGVSSIGGKLALLIAPIFILEPVLVTWTGGTLGHHLYRLKVIRLDGAGRINIFNATIRFVLKAVLGWWSFLFVLITRRRQAVHDWATRSLVVHKYPSGLAHYELLVEDNKDTDRFAYPPAWRRIAAVIVYLFLALIALVVLLTVAISRGCLQSHVCLPRERMVIAVADVALVVGASLIIVGGWDGRLWGARRSRRRSEPA